MNSPDVTFETKCYENDWKILLERNYLQSMIERCSYNFKERVLNINNVSDVDKVKRAADLLIGKNILTSYLVVEEHAEEVLSAFDIKRESFKGGYFYSIAELSALYFCKTDFLLHLSGDSIIERSQFNWIDPAINLINESHEILVANPTWNRRYWEARKESFREDDEWFYGYGFSDQCYLVKAENFKGRIYNEYNEASKRYPKYGGELFEKRVDSYMRNHQLNRISSKHISYTHKNFPRSIIGKKLLFLTDRRYRNLSRINR